MTAVTPVRLEHPLMLSAPEEGASLASCNLLIIKMRAHRE